MGFRGRAAPLVHGHGVRCLCPERARSQSPGCAEHPGSKEPGRVLYPNGVRSQASRGAAWSRSEVRSPADGESARPRGWRSYPVGVQDPTWLLRPGVLSAPRALRSCPFRAQTPIAMAAHLRCAARHRKPCPVGVPVRSLSIGLSKKKNQKGVSFGRVAVTTLSDEAFGRVAPGRTVAKPG